MSLFSHRAAVAAVFFPSSHASSRPPPEPLERRPSLLHALFRGKTKGKSQFQRAAALMVVSILPALMQIACGSAPDLTPNPETYEERSRCEIAPSLCLPTPTPEPTGTPTPTPTRNEALMQSAKDTANASRKTDAQRKEIIETTLPSPTPYTMLDLMKTRFIPQAPVQGGGIVPARGRTVDTGFPSPGFSPITGTHYCPLTANELQRMIELDGEGYEDFPGCRQYLDKKTEPGTTPRPAHWRRTPTP